MRLESRVGRFEASEALPLVQRTRCTHRDPEDDFFCLRFQVWYASLDCALRTKHKTCHGCLNCEQGRFNLKRHAANLRTPRWQLPVAGD